MNNIKHFGLRRNFDYIRVNLWIAYKSLIEYKANMYGAFFTQLFYVLTYLVFFDVVSNYFGDIVNWSRNDFLLYFILVDTVWMCAGIFLWRHSLYSVIKRGGLNTFLIRPLHAFIAHYFHNIDSGGFIMILMNMPIILYLISVSGKFSFINLIIFLCLFFFIVLFIFFVITFIESLNFYFLGFSHFVSMAYGSTANVLSQFPYQFFMSMKFRFVLFGFYLTFVSLLLIPIIQGSIELKNVLFYSSIIISLVVFFSLLVLLNWHYGLKKYEAFG